MEHSLTPCKAAFSIELFPFKTPQGEKKFWQTALDLNIFKPAFFSVTTNHLLQHTGVTKDLVLQLKSKLKCEVAAHMVLVSHSEQELITMANKYWQSGIKSVVALRGDVNDKLSPPEHRHADDLIKILKKVADFDISVAGYPEKHPEAQSMRVDLDNLKRKVDSGANRVISQFFFEPQKFLKFRDQAVACNIKVPIIPGLLPINNFPKTTEFAKKCQTQIPKMAYDIFADNKVLGTKQLDEKILAFGFLTYQILMLLKEGVDFFHFYSLNSTYLMRETIFLLQRIFNNYS